MSTINSQWLEYAEACIPPDTAEDTIASVQTTYYAGALAVLNSLNELKGLGPQQVNARFKGLGLEMDAFSRKLHDSN